eukprot:g32380.t1
MRHTFRLLRVNHKVDCISRAWAIGGRRFMSTISYYDSQSGLHVSYSTDTQVHGVVGKMKQTDKLKIPAGFSSLELADLSLLETARSTKLPLFLHANSLDLVMKNDVQGLHVSLPCNQPRAHWNNTVKLCDLAKIEGLLVKACLEDALTSDPMQIQLAASLLADAGVQLIMLQGHAGQVDEDELQEA